MAEKRIGEVVKFFAKPSVAAVKITDGELQIGDSIKFSGHTTEFTDVIQSMEVDNKPVQKAAAGQTIGLKVSDRVRPGDEVLSYARLGSDANRIVRCTPGRQTGLRAA